MEFIIVIVAFISLAALAAMIYPFKPFKSRRNALFSFLGCFVFVGAFGSQIENEANHEQINSDTLVAEQRRVDEENSARAQEVSRKKLKLELKVRELVSQERWGEGRLEFLSLQSLDASSESFSAEIEAMLLALIKPLPSRNLDGNLDGYKFLSAIRPNNASYAAKVEHYTKAKKKQRLLAVNKLRTNVDKIEGITWYHHPNEPTYLNSRSTAFLYIGRKGENGRPGLRLKVQYTSSDWLFVKNVTAWFDGEKSQLVSGYFKRDNNSRIWEWKDEAPNPRQIEIMRSLGNSNEAVLRFEGNQYRRDVTLSAGDKRAILEVLAAYEVMLNGS